MTRSTFKLLLVLCSCHFGPLEVYSSRGCEDRSCYPATGNLLIGREDKLTATSTCGATRRERYCILSHLAHSSNRRSDQKCFWCDSTSEGLRNSPRTSHRVENIVYRSEQVGGDGGGESGQYATWWQAESGVENVTIQLDLEAEFHVTHLIITFKTFRPKTMYIEKSYDWGKTWKIHRYFSANCHASFPGIHEGAPRHLNETVCQSRYSRIVPSTQGAVIYRVLPPNVNVNGPGFSPYSKAVQDLLKTTNLRIHMTQLHTMGDENLETNRPDVKEKYYYAIYDMSVRGSCSCYGHAERCLPEKREHEFVTGMVHGKCDCDHNTMGNNCELCLSDHNDLPWNPAVGKKKNECQKCDCNNHAESCYFNPTMFAASGNRSGGVCTNCTHNTEGRQCEFCISGFYQDPGLQLDHPEICKPCDCEPDGTIDEGICDGRTDEDEGKAAGQCHCKRFVDGIRCDRCLNGYWNFTRENAEDGCQVCTCDLRGIVSDEGCDQTNGKCTCKRNVIGRDCNQCMDQHYGLSSEHVNGCKPCDCDIGGALDNVCDIVTGQCRCRPFVGGRRCDEVDDGYFVGSLDFLRFEGELAYGSQNPPTTVIKREPSPVEEENTWTGFGFMQVYEGSDLTFEIPAIFRDLDYDLVLRHEQLPGYPAGWDRVNIQLVRLDGPPSGRCAQQNDTTAAASSNAGEEVFEFKIDGAADEKLYTVVEPKLCLEEGKRYRLILTFEQCDPAIPNPRAAFLIDSVVIIPRTDSVAIFDGSPARQRAKVAFQDANCREFFLPAISDQVPEECDEVLKSLSMFAFEGGFGKNCACDNTGSVSTLCDKYDGRCPCKKNVAGRTCGRCAPGFYGFGAAGCFPCQCHNKGSLDPFCRAADGQCNCAENAYGRRCNECQPGFWHFPDCRPCNCNGHADVCDARTGECVGCRSKTTGFLCQTCLEGYYGEPTLEANIPCKSCPCPGTRASGHSFADRCSLNMETKLPVCECRQEYAGDTCDACADNYHGNPEVPGGSCVACTCSNNWNFNDTGNCDPITGTCLKCLFNAEGDHCQVCKTGYHGDAVNGECLECTCNVLGTDPRRFDCDRFSGECSCLSNVEGRDCDRCIKDHWKLASATGCEYCDCDPVGSLNSTCHQHYGQCVCKDGFGGRRCDQCKENYYGNPKENSCKPCNCNHLGSRSFQCHHETGKCVCLEGIGGEKCDQCARGFVQSTALSKDHPVLDRNIPPGEHQNCVGCGECFVNWDRIIAELRNRTREKVRQAEHVKVTGATGGYSSSFAEMQRNLVQIEQILNNASISNDELVAVQSQVDTVSGVLAKTTRKLNDLDGDLATIQSSILQGQSGLDYLKSDAQSLKLEAQDMKDDITELQETNVEGALNLTRDAKRRSDEAAAKVQQIRASGGDLFNSEVQRVATEQLMNRSRLYFQKTQNQNEMALQKIVDKIEQLDEKIPLLNKQICDGSTSVDDPCDSLCGGAGCDKCGGLSCLEGALSKAGEAVSQAQNADSLLHEKHGNAERVLFDVRLARQQAESSADQARVAYDVAMAAKNRSNGELVSVSEVARKIRGFNSNEQASTPEDVKRLAEQCTEAELSLDLSEIQDLADKIHAAISGVSNADEILAETSDDLLRAKSLKDLAEGIRDEAGRQLEQAENVTLHLSEAAEAQNQAEVKIHTTQTDIDSARKNLAQIAMKMETSTAAADASVSVVKGLNERQQGLQTKYIANENRVKTAEEAAESAEKKAQTANADLYVLNAGFKNVSRTLSAKTSLIGSAKDLAIDLQRRANNLANSASNKLSLLLDVETEFEDNERRLLELSAQLVTLNCEMKIHLDVIEDKSNYYRTCSPPGTWSPQAECTCTAGSPEPSCRARRTLVNRHRGF